MRAGSPFTKTLRQTARKCKGWDHSGLRSTDFSGYFAAGVRSTTLAARMTVFFMRFSPAQ